MDMDDAPPGSVDPPFQKRGGRDGREEREEGEKRWPGFPGETVFRLIIPIHKVGSIIGRKGEFIKRMCEETRSKIKIIDAFPGADERVVLVYAKEEPEAEVPPAVDGLLRVHRQVVEGPEVDIKSPPPPEIVGTITARLMVQASQAGSLIGKQGNTIRGIQDGSGANVRVLPENSLPIFALEDDRVVEVSGPVRSVYKGLELILSHLRRFLVDRSVVPLFERPRSAVAVYGRDPALGSASPSGAASRSAAAALAHPAPPLQPPVVSIKEVTACMQIPISYTDAIIGVNGANIIYLRRTSGATVSVQETKSAGGGLEMSVEIRGTTQQVQTAEQLLQSFMAGQSGYQAGALSGNSHSLAADPYAAASYHAASTAPASNTAAPHTHTHTHTSANSSGHTSTPPSNFDRSHSDSHYYRSSHYNSTQETAYQTGGYGY